MTIYLATNDINDVYGFHRYTNTAGLFDSNYVSQAIQKDIINQGVTPAGFGHGNDNSADEEAWFHFEMYADALGNSLTDDGSLLRVFGAGKILGFIDAADGLFTPRVYDNNGGRTDALTTFALPNDQLITIDIMYKDDLTTCTFEIWINGSSVSQVTRASTGTRTMPRTLQFDFSDVTTGSTSNNFSQFIIANESTIGMKMKELRPNAIGNYTDLAADVTAVTDDDPSSGWVGSANAQKQSFTITGYTLGVGKQVHSVNVRADTRIAQTGPQNIRPFVRIGGTDYLSPADITPFEHTKRGIIGHGWTTNPATSAAWTEAAIQALEAGFEIKT